jgi:aryl-alcohol dehydrogenase
VSYILDNTGKKTGIENAFSALSSHGFMEILSSEDPIFDLNINITDLILTGKRTQGILEGDTVPNELISELVSLVHSGKFPIKDIVNTYPLDKIN